MIYCSCQTNLILYRIDAFFEKGVLYSFVVPMCLNLIKMQIPIHIGTRALCTLRYIRIGLTTNGVCIFCATASIFDFSGTVTCGNG